jgi:cysteine synthase
MARATPNLRLVSVRRRSRSESNRLDLIGDTPLLEIRKLTEGLSAEVRIYAKLEDSIPADRLRTARH